MGTIKPMSSVSHHLRPPIVPARLTFAATILVCKRCPRGRLLRRELKSAVKNAGQQRTLHVSACGCLDVCPKRGSAALLAYRDAPARCIIIDTAATVDVTLVRRLLDERVSNAVAD